MNPTNVLALLLSFTVCACASPRTERGLESNREPLIVFLVRHAEKEPDAGRDPGLTPAGRARAATLAQVLRSTGIERVHSSDTTRTRETARPTAERIGVEIELYDPRELSALAEALRSAGGRHLVVGHSNTTPALAELLCGDSGDPIDEKGEYDRLYLISIGSGGSSSSVVLRYGQPFEPVAARRAR